MTEARGDGHEFLFIPGPVEVDEQVLRALARPVPAHYGDAWNALYTRVCERLRAIFETAGEVHLLYGPGMAGMELAAGSVLSPGDRVLVCDNGTFGARMAEVCAQIGLQPQTLEVPAGLPVTGELVEEALRREPRLRALAIVHHETSAGILNDVEGACAAARRAGLLTIVDGISSVGGVELPMDEWCVDLCVTVANKALAAPVGVAPIGVGPAALAALDDGRPKAAGWYLNLATWRRYAELWHGHHPHPTTMPSNVVVALDAALGAVERRGLAEHRTRSARAAARVRDAFRELGFGMLVEERWASPLCTAVTAPPGFQLDPFLAWFRQRGIRLGGGLGPLAGRIFRVGHMGGAAEPEQVERLIDLTAEYLRRG